jgi:hypothetical protein
MVELINSCLLTSCAYFIQPELAQQERSVAPVKPEDLVWENVLQAGDDGDDPGGRRMMGLRDAPDQRYEWFCENFIQCVVPAVEWRVVHRRKLMSEYITPALEAFAILVYKNAFERWNEEYFYQRNDEASERSSLTGESVASFLYTAGSKGARKYEGWNSAGMVFYNDILYLIGQQRGRAGMTFDRDLLRRLAIKRKKKDRNDAIGPRANNDMATLASIVGV